MSREQEYFPPSGTKWKWHHKSLNYSPWSCDLSDQREPEIKFRTPLFVYLTVDKRNERWHWRVEVTDFANKRTNLAGSSSDPFMACEAAELFGEQELDKLLPDWVRTALTNNWRPPA